MPSNWGANFTVGTVPVFKYLESRDVDEVGYTLRTASLMTDPEYFLDERQPADYRLFGIRYLLLPAGRRPPVPALLEMRSGPFRLWTIRGGGYVQIGRIVGNDRGRPDRRRQTRHPGDAFRARRGQRLPQRPVRISCRQSAVAAGQGRWRAPARSGRD